MIGWPQNVVIFCCFMGYQSWLIYCPWSSFHISLYCLMVYISCYSITYQMSAWNQSRKSSWNFASNFRKYMVNLICWLIFINCYIYVIMWNIWGPYRLTLAFHLKIKTSLSCSLFMVHKKLNVSWTKLLLFSQFQKFVEKTISKNPFFNVFLSIHE